LFSAWARLLGVTCSNPEAVNGSNAWFALRLKADLDRLPGLEVFRPAALAGDTVPSGCL
jgi:hypothetical protein